jgi:hypothetical protein
MKCLCVSLCLLLFIAVTPYARDLPDPACVQCSLDPVERLLLIPDESGNLHAEFSVTVIDMWDCTTPIVGAVVEVLIGGQAGGMTRLCSGASTIGITDENGYVTFNVAGGGCYKGISAVQIRANGVTIREYYAIVSPDYAGWDNEGIPGRSDLAMTPVDLAAFAAAYQGGEGPASCHDYDNNGATDPPDLAVFVSAFGGGATFCTP